MSTVSFCLDASEDYDFAYQDLLDQLEARIEFDVDRNFCSVDHGPENGNYGFHSIEVTPRHDIIGVRFDGTAPDMIHGSIFLANDQFEGEVEYEALLIESDGVVAKYEIAAR